MFSRGGLSLNGFRGTRKCVASVDIVLRNFPTSSNSSSSKLISFKTTNSDVIVKSISSFTRMASMNGTTPPSNSPSPGPSSPQSANFSTVAVGGYSTAADGGKTEKSNLGLVETFLNLEKLDKHLFRSTHLMPGLPTSQRVYGGQVIGQALVAAGKTVPPEYHVHSCHCYFIQAGDKNIPIVYHIDPVRDGRSFATRFVKAVQDGEAIFSCQVSFHKEEPTSISHQMPMPAVPKPEELEDGSAILKRYSERKDLSEDKRQLLKERLRQIPTTFDLRPTDVDVFLRLKTAKPHYFMWVKSKGPVGDDNRLHHCIAGFISDSSMVGTALLPHLAAGFRVGMAVTLDHSMWFHRYKFNMEDWMLYETESTVAVAGRAFIHGRLWTRDGVLVMSTTQEALIRARMPSIDGSGSKFSTEIN